MLWGFAACVLSNRWRCFLNLLVLFLFACVFWSCSALSSLSHRNDAIRACAVSTVMADRTEKFVLLIYSRTAYHCSAEAHLTRAWCWGKAEARVWKVSCDVDAKKIHRFRVLIKAFLKKKGTKTAVLRRMAKGVAKLRSVVCSAPGSAPWFPPLAPPPGHKSAFTFTHLADAFIQSDLQLHSGYTFSLVCVFPGNRTHNLLRCWRDALPLSHTGTHDSILSAAEDALIKAGAPPSILLKNTHTAGL